MCWLKVSIKLLREKRVTLVPLARTHVEEIQKKIIPTKSDQVCLSESNCFNHTISVVEADLG